ncbi:MAG: hypothetical protein KAH32_05315 [Chlamydiia bacterium]|nr:hypothetical protein [Chlamydiia bacterium]
MYIDSFSKFLDKTSSSYGVKKQTTNLYKAFQQIKKALSNTAIRYSIYVTMALIVIMLKPSRLLNYIKSLMRKIIKPTIYNKSLLQGKDYNFCYSGYRYKVKDFEAWSPKAGKRIPLEQFDAAFQLLASPQRMTHIITSGKSIDNKTSRVDGDFLEISSVCPFRNGEYLIYIADSNQEADSMKSAYDDYMKLVWLVKESGVKNILVNDIYLLSSDDRGVFDGKVAAWIMPVKDAKDYMLSNIETEKNKNVCYCPDNAGKYTELVKDFVRMSSKASLSKSIFVIDGNSKSVEETLFEAFEKENNPDDLDLLIQSNLNNVMRIQEDEETKELSIKFTASLGIDNDIIDRKDEGETTLLKGMSKIAIKYCKVALIWNLHIDDIIKEIEVIEKKKITEYDKAFLRYSGTIANRILKT